MPQQDRPWLDDLDKSPVTGAELAEFERRERERDRRLDALPMMRRAREFSFRAHRWLEASRQTSVPPDDILTEAVAIAAHDTFLIQVKLGRALRGRDRSREDNDGEDPTQNDWNGSAKVALLSVERSAAAWQTIACATGEETPAMLSRLLGDLQLDIEHTFPRARSFIRPGFDEPGR